MRHAERGDGKRLRDRNNHPRAHRRRRCDDMSRHVRFFLAVLVVATGGLRSPSAAQERAADRPPSVKVPLIVGLVTVSAVHEPDKGDYESILRIDEVSADLVGYTLSGNVEDRRVTVRRKVKREDMAHAHGWRPRYNEGDPEIYPGMTGGTLSADVLNDLKTKGQTSLKASMSDDDPVGGMLKGLLGGDAGGLGSVLGSRARPAKAEGVLKRVEAQAVPVSMLVNDSRVDLEAVHARGTLGDQAFDVWVLDDAAMPIVLRWRLGDTSKKMIRIVYPVETAANRIAESLSATGRAEVYGIYFDFAKSTIRPESEPVLKEIADVMGKNPTWTLSVEGHTDNIGGAASNLDLSTRRASAVRDALVSRYRIVGGRLAPAGFGASRPKETNDTLEGRARNRRVELARQGSGQ
jgi:outer membrane protein OmpA-like peptidoglycan-associated protein